MPTVSATTFPGVYTNVIDQSFLTPSVSRFHAGVIGVATKGPLDTPTKVRSFKEFRRLFGAPPVEDTTYAVDYFLADTVSVLSDLSDGAVVVRVGHKYRPVTGAAASGTASAGTFYTGKFAQINPAVASKCNSADSAGSVYVKLSQAGKQSSVNLHVASVSNGTVTLSSGNTLKDTYTNASVSFANCPGAASSAESVLYAYNWTAVSLGGASNAGVVGSKNNFQFTTTLASSAFSAGDLLKIVETGKVTTREVRVKEVVLTSPVTVVLEPVSNIQTGYQTLPLQDNYTTAAVISKASGSKNKISIFLSAATPGTWANGEDGSTGLYVGVRPGSKPGTKKLEIHENGSLVETFDNLSEDDSDDNWFETRINGVSQFITVIANTSSFDVPANTANPWDTTLTSGTDPVAMPYGSINAGGSGGVDGSFVNGFDGGLPSDADWIGTTNSDDEISTGLKALEDTDFELDVVAAPMDDITMPVIQEIGRICKKINAVGLVDVPRGLNSRQAVDWHNGLGAYSTQGKVDSPYVAVFWNWFTMVSRFSDTGTVRSVPPSIGALRCLASVFDNDKPWFAAAGEVRGYIPEALKLEFERVSLESKAAMYGDGNSVNPILLNRGRIMLFGERTLQRLESKLTAIHSVILVNTVVRGLAQIGRRFVFDPNDAELLVHLRLAFSSFLDGIKNERGVEAYNLVIDETNNSAASRNRREVNADLYLIPTDTVERIYINAIVRESGANLVATN